LPGDYYLLSKFFAIKLTLSFSMPPDVDAALAGRWAKVAERLDSLIDTLPQEIRETAPKVCVISEFVLGVLLRQPDALIRRLGEVDKIDADVRVARLNIEGCAEAEVSARLRRYRQVEMASIAWRDIAGWADLDTCLAELSALADAMIRVSMECAIQQLAEKHGRPVTLAGIEAPLLVLAMGKLGGSELNFSSDIDLVFLYPDDVTLGGNSQLQPEEYYRRLAQTLIRLLDLRTSDGFVFRVDVRLRPFGGSGPLAVSVSAFETYLAQHGRDWERYAYVKARLVTGVAFEHEVFGNVLAPFVYRRYLDYGMFDALRKMKRLVDTEVARKEMENNIKLGSGGIREVEFIVQIFQIVRGGQDIRLRERRLLDVLPTLVELGTLAVADASELSAAYRFLRVLENRLQEMDDQQTHDLPSDPESRARLALAMACDSWKSLEQRVGSHRRSIAERFSRIAWDAVPEGRLGARSDSAVDSWELGELTRLFDDPEGKAELIEILSRFRESGLYARMDELGRRRLGQVIARFVPMLEGRDNPVAVLSRVLPILEAIGRRSAYLALLDENPTALDRVLTLAGESPMLARQMAEHPALLDELLDPRLFEPPPSRDELRRLLEHYMHSAPDNDAEAYVGAIRQFQRAAVFRVAIADRVAGLELMKVSDRLTDTAELVLESALQLARHELEAVFGKPMNGQSDNARESQFAIIAYGKLGGLELGYGSDLDLVFVHDSSGDRQETTGPRVLDNQRFFARLVQRLIHFLTIQTTSGRLYEIDMRLRPSGASGLLVTSLASLQKYQREQAWTWEHQALLRSRAVAGDSSLCVEFERERIEVLTNYVDRDGLKEAVVTMRARMRTQLASSAPGEFDLKQDLGALADIEFLIDYWVLANAAQYPTLIEYPDNVRQLESLDAAGLVSAKDCRTLKAVYIAYRSRIHERALMDLGRCVSDDEFVLERAAISELWQRTFGFNGGGER
jgi:glutamate-ammonia-ligase adenylyltransferase